MPLDPLFEILNKDKLQLHRKDIVMALEKYKIIVITLEALKKDMDIMIKRAESYEGGYDTRK